MGKLVLFFFLIGCASAPQVPTYPRDWWQDGDEVAKSWEILPSVADRSKNEVILSKRNELGLLSNFAATTFVYRGKTYASVEGFWQMMKFPEGPKDPRNKKSIKWAHTREQVAAMTAFEASRAGREASANMKKLNIDWISFEGEHIYYKTKPEGIERHYQLIFEATKAKVEQNPLVRQVLASTGKLKLLPDHKQDDTATKAYRYYDIATQIRDSL